MLLSYLYQQLGLCQHYRSYPLLLYPYPMLSVFTICCISSPLTVLTNMLCYTSLCTSSTLGTSLSFPLQVYSFSFCFTMPRPARNHGLPKAVNPASMELGQLLALLRQTLVLLASARHLMMTASSTSTFIYTILYKQRKEERKNKVQKTK